MFSKSALRWLPALALCALCGCSSIKIDAGQTVKVGGVVETLSRSANAGFRYHGEIRLKSPQRYAGKLARLFVLSHDRDARQLVGRTIHIEFNTSDLTRSLEPQPDPFSVAQPDSHLDLIYRGGAIKPLDYTQFDQPVFARGKIHTYVPQEDSAMYFVYDMGFTGTMVTVEISEPATYRGTLVHILVDTEDSHIDASLKTGWSKIGTEVGFELPESTFAWEPWGFTPLMFVHKVTFHSSDHSQ